MELSCDETVPHLGIFRYMVKLRSPTLASLASLLPTAEACDCVTARIERDLYVDGHI
jgi:hypothetical protein